MFDNSNLVSAPFRAALSNRLLLHPLRPPLERTDWEAVITAAAAAGDVEAFIERIEGTPETLGETWLISLNDPSFYEEIAPDQGSIAWSPSARWGILMSGEDFLLAASVDAQFIEVLAREVGRLPQYVEEGEPPRDAAPPEQLNEFISLWHELNGPEWSWADQIVDHVRGKNT